MPGVVVTLEGEYYPSQSGVRDFTCALAGYLEVSLVSYAAEIRPVHVADLLSREGHPLAARVTAAREARADAAEPRDFDAAAAARRTLGVAAGAMLVVGTVVAGALGLNHSPSAGPTAAAGEPVGALPGNGGPAQQPNQVPAKAAVAPQFTNASEAKTLPQSPSGPAGQIGVPAKVPPPAAAKPAPRPAAPAAPAQPAPAAAAPGPAAPQSTGPVQTLTAPVATTVGGSTLDNAVAPVTSTVDNTLAPALSLIGGLLTPLG